MPCLFIFIMHYGLQGRKRIEENSLWTVTVIPLGPLRRAASAAGCTEARAHKPGWELQRPYRHHLHTQCWSCAMNVHRVTLGNWDQVKQKRIFRIRSPMHTNRHFWSCCACTPALGLPEAGGHRPRLEASPAQQHLALSQCSEVPLAWMTECVRDGGSFTFGHCMTQPPPLWGHHPKSAWGPPVWWVVITQRQNGCRHLWADPERAGERDSKRSQRVISLPFLLVCSLFPKLPNPGVGHRWWWLLTDLSPGGSEGYILKLKGKWLIRDICILKNTF